MAQQKRGLGKGLGALIPTGPGTPPGGAPPGGAAPGGPGTAGGTTAAPGVPAGPGAEQPATAGGAYFQELPISSVTPNPRQPRQVFDDDALDELVASIQEVGLLQPVVVREVSRGRFELVMGERRWRASQRGGLTEIPAMVGATTDEH